MWRKEEFPQNIHLYIQKGNPEVFDRQDLFRKVNADFRDDRKTIDDFHIARQIHEKCQEQKVDLYMALVNFTKKFKQSCERLAKIWAVKVNHGQMVILWE